MAKTFKQMQDNVLEWMADQNDTSLMRTLVKQALNQAQVQLLTKEQYDFMLHPQKKTLSVVSGQQVYPLPDNWQQGLYVKNPTTKEYLIEIPIRGLNQSIDSLIVDDTPNLCQYSITAVTNVMNQPASAGVVVVTTTGGSEAAADGIVVHGLDANGVWVEETLGSGSTWTELTGSTSFASISNIIKAGTAWTRTITVTVGATTIAQFGPAEYAKQYQQLEFANMPTASTSFEYRYYVKPIKLVWDNQPAQVPEPFEDILEYKALIKLQGYSRATETEVGQWINAAEELTGQLAQTYQQARTLNAQLRRTTYNERY